MAADGGCERDVVHRMNEGRELKSVLNKRIEDKGQEVVYTKE